MWPNHPNTCAEVQAAVHKRVAELVSWSMAWAAKGKWPQKGFEGEVFDSKTLRFAYRGKLLAEDWRHV